MTGQERTLRALDFLPTDRVPVAGGFIRSPEFLASAAGVTVDEFWDRPREIAARAFRTVGADVVIGLILPNRSSRVGAEVEHGGESEFDSPEAVVQFIDKLPEPEAAAAEVDCGAEYERYLNLYCEGQHQVGADLLWLPTCFRYVAQFQNEKLFGTENYYMALALYPEAMGRFFEHSAAIAYARNTAVARTIVENDLPRVMWVGQDACDNRGPYIAPDTMNEIYIRHVKHSLEPLKSVGVKIIWHSDGNIAPIARYLLDAGVDGFQGLQETIETKVNIPALRELKTWDGRPPVIVGSVSSVTTMPFGTPEEVAAEVARCTDLATEKGGGWILNFSSSLGPEVPEANIRAFYQSAR